MTTAHSRLPESARSAVDVDLDTTAPATVTRHDPTLSRFTYGSWCNCTCGWDSGTYSTVTGAHYAFGEHLLASGGTP